METFDRTEYERWFATAGTGLAAARHAGDGGFHHIAVLQAEQAAQCALKALLHAVGAGSEARGHDLLRLAAACERLAGLALDDGHATRLRALGNDYMPTRYPDALPGGTPADYYDGEQATAAITTAEQLLAAVAATWEGLEREAAATHEMPDDGTLEPGP